MQIKHLSLCFAADKQLPDKDDRPKYDVQQQTTGKKVQYDPANDKKPASKKEKSE